MATKTYSFAESFSKYISDDTVSLVLMAKKIPHLTLEGKVFCESGKLLIIDPCYLEGFDLRAYDLYEKEYQKAEVEILKAQCETFPKIRRSKLPKNPSESEVKKHLESREKWLKEMEAGLKTRKELEKKHAEFQRDYFLAPPHMLQTRDYIVFRNGIGDGHYPVIKKTGSYNVVFNYPINSKGYTDKTKLDGKLVGHSCVDSAAQMIIDPITSKALKKISRDIPKTAYCVIDLNPGEYSHRFLKDNEALSIKFKRDLAK